MNETVICHDNCARCMSLRTEAIESAVKYGKPSWTSVDGPHGASIVLGLHVGASQEDTQ